MLTIGTHHTAAIRHRAHWAHQGLRFALPAAPPSPIMHTISNHGLTLIEQADIGPLPPYIAHYSSLSVKESYGLFCDTGSDRSVGRGLADLAGKGGLYASDDDRPLLNQLSHLPPDSRILVIGAGRGNVILDIRDYFASLGRDDIAIHFVNKESNLLHDLSTLMERISPEEEDIAHRIASHQVSLKDADLRRAIQDFRFLHDPAFYHPMDISHGRGLDRLPHPFHLVIIATMTLPYIHGQFAVLEKLYDLTTPGGALYSLIPQFHWLRRALGVVPDKTTLKMFHQILGEESVTLINPFHPEGPSMRITRTDRPLRIPFMFQEHLPTGAEVYGPANFTEGQQR